MNAFAWLDSLFSSLPEKESAEVEADRLARLRVDQSAEDRQRFEESRGLLRDQEQRAREMQYRTAIQAAPTVPYTDGTPGATPRNNRSANLPKPVIERIATTARAHGVDPYTAIAVALMETNGGTAKDYPSAVNPLHSNAFRDSNVFDAIPASVAHIKQLMDKYPGQEAKAIQGYNGFGRSYIPQKVPYNQKVLQFRDDLMRQPAISDVVNLAGKR